MPAYWPVGCLLHNLHVVEAVLMHSRHKKYGLNNIMEELENGAVPGHSRSNMTAVVQRSRRKRGKFVRSDCFT